jgi:thiosulfate/3-mercaptopyruvate sulfurtransferase
MPGALNLPFTELLSADKRDFRPLAALKAAFGKAGVDLSRPIITSCGSGITAAILLEAALRAGATTVRLYDGSWAQWGDPRAATPVATGS